MRQTPVCRYVRRPGRLPIGDPADGQSAPRWREGVKADSGVFAEFHALRLTEGNLRQIRDFSVMPVSVRRDCKKNAANASLPLRSEARAIANRRSSGRPVRATLA